MSLLMQKPPHIRSSDSNVTFYIDVMVATIPLYAMAVYFYGVRALFLALVGITSAIASDCLCVILSGKYINIRDLSPVITGLIIPLLMPASIPYYIVVVACFISIVVAKAPFGGVGENIFNPAAVGMSFAIICWPKEIFSYPAPFEYLPVFNIAKASFKVVASPANALSLGGLPKDHLIDMLLGNVAGPMGSVNILILVTCFLYLVVRRTIKVTMTASFILSVSFFSLIFPRVPNAPVSCLYELMSGSLMLFAVFMINEPVTSPKRHIPMTVYGVLTGLACIIFRHLGRYEESIFFALIIMNSTVWLLDILGERITEGWRQKNGD